MAQPKKLPLLKQSLKLLIREMTAADRISLVVYAGAAGVVLEPTAGDQTATIEAALEALQSGGSTHGSAGIQLAYAKAREAFIADGINRVILATDGDFNVGVVDRRALTDLVARERRGGIALTTLGFGAGNLNDELMEQLSHHGDGNYAYIDSLLEARKVLVEQMGGTLITVAGDVKIQVEFNPRRVAEYRLVGYENRVLQREDFNNDAVDAGELGAGHSIVALYELSLTDEGKRMLEPLRYGRAPAPSGKQHGSEYAFLKLRYKLPGHENSDLVNHPIDDLALQPDRVDDDFLFSAAVAAFAQRLRGGVHLNGFDYPDIQALARAARGEDRKGYRAEFVRVVGLAQSLDSYPAKKAASDGADG
jgi:Ca-activated chloride channel family protein